MSEEERIEEKLKNKTQNTINTHSISSYYWEKIKVSHKGDRKKFLPG